MGLVSFINKDVRNENETKQGVVSVRILYIIILLAYALNTIFAGFPVLERFPVRMIVIPVILILLFVNTYFARASATLVFFLLFCFVYSLAMIPCFGWSAGMQNYFIIILVVCFYAVHGSMGFKIALTALVLVARIITIFVYSGMPPEVSIPEVNGKLIQSSNISAVFLSVVILTYIFSHKENEAESKLMQYNTRLLREANTDKLTGLANRRFALDYLEDLKKTSFLGAVSVCMADIDFFKKVNDTYGHDAGDAVLKTVAEALKNCGDENTLVSRWGGEEFLVVFTGKNGDEAFAILEDLRGEIEKKTIHAGEQEIHVTMTFGLTEYDFSGDTEAAIKEADEKLYIGKTGGRNRVVY